MVQKLNYPNTELEFRTLQDKMYQITKDCLDKNEPVSFKGLLEIISSEAVILSAIHRIKRNKGSKTPGVDGKNINDLIQLPYEEVIKLVKDKLTNYKPHKIRRVHILKGDSNEVRPLGIPTMIDRIIQECIKSVIEPIIEAQFFRHSYGFRPMRDTHMAMERIKDIVYKTGFHWFVEGDISKFFDNVNHTILIKRLWGMGIRDRRVLMIIKSMLKAGILNELQTSEIGTPQGSVISPLLGNVYLDAMDKWITREWENKQTKHKYSSNQNRFKALRTRGNFKEVYLVRYADDWVLITNSKRNAEVWKWRVSKFLKDRLKLTLSDKKTVITNIRRKAIKFVGFEFKIIRGKSKNGYISRVSPNKERLRKKINEIKKEAHKLRFSKTNLAHHFNLINSKIRGLIEYYTPANTVNVELQNYQHSLHNKALKSLQRRRTRGKNAHKFWELLPANEVDNLRSVHSRYKTKILVIKADNMKIGLTSLAFSKWEMPPLKNQKETPYSIEGRELYRKRTNKKPVLARADELLSTHLSAVLAFNRPGNRYNFEYFLNRAYAFNRDKGKCRICGGLVSTYDVTIHHIRPNLPIDEVNKVSELATVHEKCHAMIHDKKDYSLLNTKVWKKIKVFREKLGALNY